MNVTIIDYGLSNLLSVERAVKKLGHSPHIARTGDEVRRAEVLLLPGVGAFDGGMHGLMERDMLRPILGCAESGVPILGICLGMQMLFDASRENGIHRGLGLIPGYVEPIQATDIGGGLLRVPHIGWEGLLPRKGMPLFPSFLANCVHQHDEVYFVHSYVAKSADTTHTLAECDYGGRRLCAAVGKGKVFGTQFHPEKSGPVGLGILDGFFRHAAGQAGESIA